MLWQRVKGELMKARARYLLYYADSDYLEAVIAILSLLLMPLANSLLQVLPEWYIIPSKVSGLALMIGVMTGNLSLRFFSLLACLALFTSLLAQEMHVYGLTLFLGLYLSIWIVICFCTMRVQRERQVRRLRDDS